MFKKIVYYLCLFVILFLSFRIYSSVFFPGLNSDHAVTILMVHYFHLPDDLYFWGQDRMGSVIPLLAQVPFKLFKVPAIYSEAIAHYSILIIGFLTISTFFKSYFVRMLFALIWFLPPEREIDITQLTLSIQYVFLFIGIYFIFKQNNTVNSNFKKHIYLLFVVLAFITAIWDSDLAMVSVGVFISLYIFYLMRENSLKSIYKKHELYYFLSGIIVCILFITYAKGHSPVRNNYSLISKSDEIVESLKIFYTTVSDIFLFKINEKLTSVYSYLVLLTVILATLSWRKIKFSDKKTKRIFLFLFFDLIVVFIVILITKWTYLNGVPRRYFNCTYISLSIMILLILENTETGRLRKFILKYTLLIAVLLGSFGTIYTLKVVWYHSFKPYADYMDDLNKLGKIGIIGDYWNSYICSVKNPEAIKATPHDKSCVRNRNLVNEVFKQEEIYLIKDGWLDSFPDTIKQFGRTIIKQDEPFKLANATLCRYKIINSK